MSAPGWPATLADGPVVLRPLRLRDAPAWTEVRLSNERWLSPWEATKPDVAWSERHGAATFTPMLRALRRQARSGAAMPFFIVVDGMLAGQVTLGPIVRGAMNSASVGYWIDHRVAGRGVMPTALALLVDHSFDVAGLHRVAADIRPENTASRRVVEKLGFREEGLHQRLLFIDGAYRDHLTFAVTREEVPEGMLRRWRSVRRG